MKPNFFKSSAELRRWFDKNHNKKTELWMIFYRKGQGDQLLTQKEAFDQALCFGWTMGVLKNQDYMTYLVRFLPRKIKGTWSLNSIKRFKELQKLKLVRPSGIKAFESRDKSKSEEKKAQFSVQQIKIFKANKKAWDFFQSQTKSYQHYMIRWVTSAKMPETRAKRLKMLIEDSGQGTKLKRVVEAINKYKKKFEPGKTPIEEGKNLGPATGAELRSIGIETLEQLKKIGWEKAFYRLCEMYPRRINLNMAAALVGAVEEQNWRKIDPDLKAEAQDLVVRMKRFF